MEALKENIKTIEDWYNTPEDMRVELIDGVFYNMATPTWVHQDFVGELSYRIKQYINDKNGDCKVFPSPFGVQPDADDDRTVVEPDITVLCDKSKLNEHICVGAPDWIIEIISPSTASRDYVWKREKYMNAGVREYWIVDPGNKVVSVFVSEAPLDSQTYTFKDKVKAGIYEDLYIDFDEVCKRIGIE